ncbi:mechanosensitive ion channel family protein [Nitratireductor basaltis]|uniref:Mechanosensitive ion channel MscS n=1 Tax=Nitratireductor basaltis TaxID=472175 RepID=A0A084U9Y5_9HYPH|nr:mechanosensitive ion channel family protein [Nitratireductor basaltis]KFB09771.1 Mechanosensitive ion channel MscS [Nitratireductor basaltis]
MKPVSIVFFLLFLSLGALAQSELVQQQQNEIADINEETESLSEKVSSEDVDDAELVAARLELERLSRELLQSGVAFRPRLTEINDRLDQLGPARGEGEPPEPEIVVQERQRLLDEKATINAMIGEAETLSVRIGRLIDQVAQKRRELFTNALSRRFDISAAFGPEVAKEFTGDIERLYNSVSSWLNYVVQVKLRAALLAAGASLICALALLMGGRRYFSDLIAPDIENDDPSYLARLSVALWSTLLPSAALGIFLALTYLLFDTFNVLREDIAQLLATLFIVIGTVFFVYRLTRSALAPHRANWRLLPIECSASSRLCWLIAAMAGVTAFDYFMGQVYSVIGSQLSLTVATSLGATVAVGVLLILIGMVKPFPPEEEGDKPRPWPLAFRLPIFLFGIATILAAIFGYIGFARFLSQQVVVTGAILATMYIGFLTSGAIAGEGAFGRSRIGHMMGERLGLDEGVLDQLGLVAGLGINVLVVLIGAPMILLQWGFHFADLTTWTYGIANEIRIGSISFSIIGILTGIVVLVLGYFITRWFQAWLDGSVMSRSRMDTGVRNSIRTAVGYVGIAIAALIGISAAGIDLSNLALVAGALSLGIGFGLQNIVSNFVSGLILLVERPFKAGDWIVAGAVSGTVKKISVRATEIETFQRQTVILPNSELINAAVGNWTHKNSLGRLEIPIGVAYGSDVRRVHEILMGIAKSHPLVLKNPEPFVHFANFGDSSLDFEVRVYLADILRQLEVQNDIRFAIIEAFEKEGIEIPFPQRDLHLRGGFVVAPKEDAAHEKTTDRNGQENG